MTPAVHRGRFDPQPDGGQVRVGREVQELDVLPGPDHAFHVGQAGRLEHRVHPVLALEDRGDDLLLDLAVQGHHDLRIVGTGHPADVAGPAQGDQRVLLGQFGQSGEQGPPPPGIDGVDDGLQGRTREPDRLPLVPQTDGVAHLDPGQTPHDRDLALVGTAEVGAPGRGEDLHARHPGRSASVDPDPVARRQLPGAQTQVGPALVARRPLDLEHLGPQRPGAPVDAAPEPGHQFRAQLGHSGTGQGAAAMDREQPGPAHESGQGGVPGRGVEPARPVPLGERGLVPQGDGLVQRHVVGRPGDHVRAEARGDLGRHPVGVGPTPVDLVDEEDGGQPQALQGAHQHHGLGLHALDRADHEHGGVQNGQGAFDLGDEVTVPRGVDEVDQHTLGLEGRNRGPDGDAALALERHGVGLGGAGVDRADVVDHTRVVEQAFGQGGLTGVDVRQDPEVEGSTRCSQELSRPR